MAEPEETAEGGSEIAAEAEANVGFVSAGFECLEYLGMSGS